MNGHVRYRSRWDEENRRRWDEFVGMVEAIPDVESPGGTSSMGAIIAEREQADVNDSLEPVFGWAAAVAADEIEVRALTEDDLDQLDSMIPLTMTAQAARDAGFELTDFFRSLEYPEADVIE